MNRYQRPREVRRREAKRLADVVYRRYLRPLGIRGHAQVELIGSRQQKVAGNVSGRTFAPGTVVPVGRHQDEYGEVILGSPPPGRGGGFPVIRTSGTLGSPLPATFEALGYHHDGAGAWSLLLYTSGSPWEVAETLAAVETGDATVSQPWRIVTDSAGAVAADSLAYGVGTAQAIAELGVVDLAADAVFHRATAAGRYSTGGHFVGGYLYWVEFEQESTGSQVARLYRSRADFTETTALGTATTANEVTTQGWELQWSALTEAAIVAEIWWTDTTNFEVSGVRRFRIPLAGGAGSAHTPGSGYPIVPPSPGVPAAAGGALLAGLDGPYEIADAPDSTPALIWPTEWAVASLINVSRANGNVYAYFDDGDAPRLARAVDGGPYGEAPDASDEVISAGAAPLLFVPR